MFVFLRHRGFGGCLCEISITLVHAVAEKVGVIGQQGHVGA